MSAEAGPGPYSALTPVRICDTRAGNPSGLSGPAAQCNGAGDGNPANAGQTLTIQVSGLAGVPVDATAVVVNLGSTNLVVDVLGWYS
ncbi:MAG: hypothetical protein ACLPVF_11865 [Acidimicrobiales bacterium]